MGEQAEVVNLSTEEKPRRPLKRLRSERPEKQVLSLVDSDDDDALDGGRLLDSAGQGAERHFTHPRLVTHWGALEDQHTGARSGAERPIYRPPSARFRRAPLHQPRNTVNLSPIVVDDDEEDSAASGPRNGSSLLRRLSGLSRSPYGTREGQGLASNQDGGVLMPRPLMVAGGPNAGTGLFDAAAAAAAAAATVMVADATDPHQVLLPHLRGPPVPVHEPTTAATGPQSPGMHLRARRLPLPFPRQQRRLPVGPPGANVNAAVAGGSSDSPSSSGPAFLMARLPEEIVTRRLLEDFRQQQQQQQMPPPQLPRQSRLPQQYHHHHHHHHQQQPQFGVGSGQDSDEQEEADLRLAERLQAEEDERLARRFEEEQHRDMMDLSRGGGSGPEPAADGAGFQRDVRSRQEVSAATPTRTGFVDAGASEAAPATLAARWSRLDMFETLESASREAEAGGRRGAAMADRGARRSDRADRAAIAAGFHAAFDMERERERQREREREAAGMWRGIPRGLRGAGGMLMFGGPPELDVPEGVDAAAAMAAAAGLAGVNRSLGDASGTGGGGGGRSRWSSRAMMPDMMLPAISMAPLLGLGRVLGGPPMPRPGEGDDAAAAAYHAHRRARHAAYREHAMAVREQLLAAQRAGIPSHLLLSDRDFTPEDYEMLCRLDERVENRKGAKEEQLEALPQEVVGAEGRRCSDGNMARCTICLEDVVPGDTLKRLPCGHDFHGGCLDTWLKTKAVCPICQRELGDMGV